MMVNLVRSETWEVRTSEDKGITKGLERMVLTNYIRVTLYKGTFILV